MADIEIKSNELSSLVERLEKDNIDISETLKKINIAIRTLDEKVWNSPEKKRMDEQMIPFMEKVDKTVYENLKQYTDKIKIAIKKYSESEMSIKKKVENFYDSTKIDTL